VTGVSVAVVQTIGDLIGGKGLTTNRTAQLSPAIEALPAPLSPTREAPPLCVDIFARLDQRPRSFLSDKQCDACKRIGHEAINCNMLALALFIERHKQSLSDSERNEIEPKWLARCKERLGQAAHTPCQVMHTYCDVMNITTKVRGSWGEKTIGRGQGGHSTWLSPPLFMVS
jgi:hypothetical protein